MKLAHNIIISVFAKDDEDYDKISSGLFRLIPFDILKEKIIVEEIKAKGLECPEIKIMEAKLIKDRHVNGFLKNLNNALPEEQKKKLMDQYLSRLDEDLNFYIRLDKGELLEGKHKLTDKGDCFHIKIHLACYPEKTEIAKGLLKQIFKY
ncbi:MAG: RNA-binding domain-containing protein [Candidatus Woesearchaeota archaeon]